MYSNPALTCNTILSSIMNSDVYLDNDFCLLNEVISICWLPLFIVPLWIFSVQITTNKHVTLSYIEIVSVVTLVFTLNSKSDYSYLFTIEKICIADKWSVFRYSKIYIYWLLVDSKFVIFDGTYFPRLRLVKLLFRGPINFLKIAS